MREPDGDLRPPAQKAYNFDRSAGPGTSRAQSAGGAHRRTSAAPANNVQLTPFILRERLTISLHSPSARRTGCGSAADAVSARARWRRWMEVAGMNSELTLGSICARPGKPRRAFSCADGE